MESHFSVLMAGSAPLIVRSNTVVYVPFEAILEVIWVMLKKLSNKGERVP